MNRTLRILGTRGIPAAHGGFESFAETLALHLVRRGWRVVVYCQEPGSGLVIRDTWHGIERVRIPMARDDALGTVLFDWRCVVDAARHADPCLTLGYNTALFTGLLRLRGIFNVINMDGIEWRRSKWRLHQRAWLRLNEQLGCRLASHLIADHPQIARHLARWVAPHRVTTIPYGAPELTEANPRLLRSLSLAPGGFATLIARPEPENGILEAVRAWSLRPRGCRLVVLGAYRPRSNAYHRTVLEAAGPEVLFPGAIYDKALLGALRVFGRLYIHGHRVGGTNPSLVEALGAGSPVLAHDNPFNRWVAGPSAAYFSGEADCAARLDELLDDPVRLAAMGAASRLRFRDAFTLERMLEDYEVWLDRWLGAPAPMPRRSPRGEGLPDET